MTCIVVTEKPGVPVSRMEDGDLAVVVEWQHIPRLIGKVIQRCEGDCLVVIGEDSTFSEGALNRTIRVRILQSGDTIRID